MIKKKVLFICIHNSARSQMAEALLNQLCGDQFEAYSAGLTPGKLNPLAVEVLREEGIDISRHGTQSVSAVIESGSQFDYVITVCDETSAERCPVFPGAATCLHWSFPDPSGFEGSWEEKLAKTGDVRDQIKTKIAAWCQANNTAS